MCVCVCVCVCVYVLMCVAGRGGPLKRERAHAERASPAVTAITSDSGHKLEAHCVCLSVCVCVCARACVCIVAAPPRHSPQPLASFLPFVKPARQTSSS